MGVFLRWGVFGILAAAALFYAYHSSKKLSERHQIPPHCELELQVARSALLARSQGAPMEDVLRMHVETLELDDPRRQRLREVVVQWYGLEGPSPDPITLRRTVASRCLSVTSAS